MNEVEREFLLETHENLSQIDLDLVALEKEPGDLKTLARVFRNLHTVKGSSGFLGLKKLQGVSHSAESLLSRLRAGEIAFTPEIASALLAVVDVIRRILASIEQAGGEGDGEYSALIKEVDRLREGGQAQTPAVAVAPAAAGADPPVTAEWPAVQVPQASPPAPPAPQRVEATRPAVLDQTVELAPPLLVRQPEAVPSPPAPAPLAASAPSPSKGIAASSRGPSVEAKGLAVPEESEPRSSAVSDSAIRVDVGLLDKLMTLVGELVLARNQIMQFGASHEDAAFLGPVQRLNLLTTELQVNVMKTRMQPIGSIWNKFPRVVRDLAVACGKQVRLDLEGQETELDKTIIEAIRDPLTHMIRNAVDHGIETPAEREAKGKPAEGRLSLHAFHEGGKVLIEIVDDGKGVDPRRVREKAIQAKLITPEQADRLGDRELINLIFLPGFSTADKVTHFSGRGVGMDVVRTNVEKIGGTVDMDSRPGRGATVKMKIPLTLAIIPALTVTDGAERYAIPQVSLLELVRLEGEQAHRSVEQIHGAPVHRLRGNLLPLVYLHRELHGGPARAQNGVTNIVVLQADDRQFGLVVDEIHDTEEIVVKPLQKQVKGISAFSGATIMGDGKVALILDVLGLAQRANVVSGVRERTLAEKPSDATDSSGDRRTMLLFATRDGGRMAIPLSLVARLEEFPRSAIERAGRRDLVQYRGEILPLVDLSRVLRRLGRPHGASNGRHRAGRASDATPAPCADDVVPVVVYSDGGRMVGLVVGQILDIVEETLDSKCRAGRPGVLFTAVVQGRVTEFLDIEAIIRSADPNFFAQPEPVGAGA